MKKVFGAVAFMSALLLAAATASAALVDSFLKIDNIMGESQDRVHKNEIEVDSWNFGGMMTGVDAASKTQVSAKAQIQPFQFTMKVSRPPALYFCRCLPANAFRKPF